VERFYRIRRWHALRVEQVNRAKDVARNAGATSSELGMGNPDRRHPLKSSRRDGDRSASRAPIAIFRTKGIPGLAARRPLLCPPLRLSSIRIHQIVGHAWIEEGLHLAQAITRRAIVVLSPNKSYPDPLPSVF